MKDTNTLPPVAKSVLYPCKKCDAEKYHRVLAHKTSTSAAIECEACGSKKTYKLATKTKKTATRKKSTGRSKIPKMWEELNEKSDSETVIPYKVTHTFQENQTIDHIKFGKGFVTKSLAHKIEVVFKDSIKELVHNR